MSRFFRKLHGRLEPPGMEMAVLRRIPRVFFAGTGSLAATALLARLWPADGSAIEAAKQVGTVDILVIATLLTFWTAIVTVAIGCVIVYVMKGPAYVADAYPLIDAPEPAPDRPVNRTQFGVGPR